MAMPERFQRLLVMNTAIMAGPAKSPAFDEWKADITSNPDVPLADIMQKYEPVINDAEAAAYAAPYPDQRYKAGVRRFPMMVATSEDAEGIDVSRKAAGFWQNDWQGESFMAIGMQDKMLGPTVMHYLKGLIRGCPEPMEIPEAGHFVQEHGKAVAEKALAHFGLQKE